MNRFKYHILITLSVLIIFTSIGFGFYKKGVGDSKKKVTVFFNKMIHNKREKIRIEEENIENKEHIEELSSIIDSLQYENLKLKVEKESGIRIPRDVPREHFLKMIEEANKNKIPYAIYFRLIYAESRFDSSAVSRVGAYGYMQIMPGTFRILSKELNLEGGNTPENNIVAGSYYLRKIHNYWKRNDHLESNDWSITLASYNAGIDRVKRLKRIPNITETKNYVAYIIKKYDKNAKII